MIFPCFTAWNSQHSRCSNRYHHLSIAARWTSKRSLDPCGPPSGSSKPVQTKGKSWENRGKMMTWVENHGEDHGKIIGKWWERLMFDCVQLTALRFRTGHDMSMPGSIEGLRCSEVPESVSAHSTTVPWYPTMAISKHAASSRCEWAYDIYMLYLHLTCRH